MFSHIPSNLRAVVRRCIIWGGSARLAVALLFALALVCAAATFCESKYDAQVARAWFYNAPWFTYLMGLLAVNLICATWKRWPWRWKHVGFIAVHYGIVILLGGALIDRKFGFETFLTLHTPETVNESQIIFANRAPVVVQHSGTPSGVYCSLVTEKNDLRLMVRTRSIESEGFALSTVLGKTLQPAGTPLRIEIQKYWPDFAMEGGRPTSRSEAPNNPAVQVQLTGTIGSKATEIETAIAQKFGTDIGLIRFEVPRDENDAPTDFRSAISFTDRATHQTSEAIISTNHPAHYPGGIWRTALGLNAQFSQAQWNPADLGETTIEVSRDPGFPFKWFGSLLIVLGGIKLLSRSPKHCST